VGQKVSTWHGLLCYVGATGASPFPVMPTAVETSASMSCRGAGTSASVYRLGFGAVEIDFGKLKHITQSPAAFRTFYDEVSS